MNYLPLDVKQSITISVYFLKYGFEYNKAVREILKVSLELTLWTSFVYLLIAKTRFHPSFENNVRGNFKVRLAKRYTLDGSWECALKVSFIPELEA